MIIAELEKNINKGGHSKWLADELQFLLLSGSEAHNLEIIFRCLARLVDTDKTKDLLAEKSQFWNVTVRFGLPGLGAEVSRSSETHSKSPSAALSLFMEWLGFHSSQLKSPVIIAIDEAQNLSSGKESPSNQLLQDIRENTSKLPISLLLAGLSDPQSHASSMGLTREVNGLCD